MQPDFHSRIEAKHVKSVEQVVLKTQEAQDPPEPLSPCPSCGTHIPQS